MKYYKAFFLNYSILALLCVSDRGHCEGIGAKYPFQLKGGAVSGPAPALNPLPVGPLEKPVIEKNGPAYDKGDAWDGPYVGLMFVYDFGTSKLTAPGNGLNVYPRSVGFQGPGAELLAGWGKTFNKYYLGLEVSASLFDSDGKNSVNALTGRPGERNVLKAKVAKKDSFGFAARIGYKVHEKALVYVKGGVASSKFDVNLASNFSLSPGSNNSRTIHKRFSGIAGGLGTEIKMTDRILGRFEASHTQYGRQNIGANLPDGAHNTHFKPKSSEIKLGIVIPLGRK